MEIDEKELLKTLACRFVKLKQTIEQLRRQLNSCLAIQLQACEQLSQLGDEWNDTFKPDVQETSASVEALKEVWESDTNVRALFRSFGDFVAFARRHDASLNHTTEGL